MATQVFPPSMLYCQLYAARCPADAATSLTEPVTSPCTALNTRGARTAVLRTPMPALWMMPSPSATLASATVCTYVFSCSSSCTSALRLALRVAAAPLVRARAAASAVWKSPMALVTVASAGTGDGKAALPVMDVTICCAIAASPETLFGSLRTATERCVWVASLVIESLLVLGHFTSHIHGS